MQYVDLKIDFNNNINLLLDSSKIHVDLEDLVVGHTFNQKIVKKELEQGNFKFTNYEIGNVSSIAFYENVLKQDLYDYTNILKSILDYNKIVSCQFPLSYNLNKDILCASYYAKLDYNKVYIKTPFTKYGLLFLQKLKQKNIKTNLTLITTPRELHLYHAISLKSDFISIFYHSIKESLDDYTNNLIKHLLNEHDQKIIFGQIRSLKEFLQLLYKYEREDYRHSNIYITVKPNIFYEYLNEIDKQNSSILKNWDEYASNKYR